MKLYEKTSHELRALLDQREISATELARSVLERARATESAIGAYITLCEQTVMEEAEAADKRIQEGDEVHALTGIPVALKDNISTRGIKTTAASNMLKDYVPPYDATVTQIFKEAGAPIVGKANLDEFAMGSTTETSALQKTRNPWDVTRTPGGSSGGSAAAVSAGSAIGSLGTDTGGSIRLPAAYCGLVGVKPTYGRVSRYGVFPMAASFDTVGPIAKDVRDAAIFLQAISGPDKMDSTCSARDVPDYVSGLGQDIKGVVIGVPKQLLSGIAPDVKQSVEAAIQTLAGLGAIIEEVSLPHVMLSTAVYRILVASEVSSAMARFDGVRYGLRAEGVEDVVTMMEETRRLGFGAEVKHRIIRGTYALTGDYFEKAFVRAQKARTLIMSDFEKVFEKVSALVLPASARVAPKLTSDSSSGGTGSNNGTRGGADEAETYTDLLTIPMNIAGLPALSLPCGRSESGLPIGLQMTGPAFSEAFLLQLAYAFEQAAGIAPLTPSLEVV